MKCEICGKPTLDMVFMRNMCKDHELKFTKLLTQKAYELIQMIKQEEEDPYPDPDSDELMLQENVQRGRHDEEDILDKVPQADIDEINDLFGSDTEYRGGRRNR